MACLLQHNWGWPRRRGDRHMQVCIECGAERESRVQFDAPRYRRTQEPSPRMTVVETRGKARPIALPNVA